MAEESDDIILSISADVAALRRSQKKMEEFISGFAKTADKKLNSVASSADKNFKAIEGSARRMRKQLDGVFAKPFGSLANPLAGIGAALGVNELRKMTDTWTDMTSRVNLAAGSMEKGTVVMGRLGEMARRTYSDLSQTSESYLANANTLKELGYSTNQTLDYTESLNNALVVSAAKGQRAATVTEALSKAMALGKLSGVNLNTVIAQGGRVAEALAAGLGTTVAGLRKLGAQGKITGNDIVKALSSQMEVLRKEAAAMPATIGDGFTLLNNALLEYVGNADHATGISAKISDALVIIADNFDKVADAGLQLAAVFAGVLIGRSFGGMIKTLGLTAVALRDFTRALAAAKGAGEMASALGGLGAVAGPLGAIIGGALVLSIGSYAKASWDAARNSDQLTAEMEKLGLVSSKAASEIDGTAESLDKLSDAARIRKLKSINDELDRLRTGGNLFGKGDELNSIAANARSPLKNAYQNFTMSEADKSGRRQIAQMADDFAKFMISADDVKAKLKEINDTNVSMGVVELGDALLGTVEHMAAAEAYSTRYGRTLEDNIGKVGEEIQNLNVHFKDAADAEIISQEQYDDLNKLVTEFTKTGNGADTLRQRLADITKDKPNFNWLHGEFNDLITKMLVVIKTAQAAGRAMSMATASGPDETKATRSALDPYIIQRKAEQETADQFEKNALRKAALKKDELARELKIADVRKRLEAEGVTHAPISQIERIADAELAADKARSGEGKKPPKDKRHAKTADQQVDSDIQAVRDRTAALVAETAAVGLSYQEGEKRKIALDLEQAALAKLRDEAIKKGETDLSGIKISEEQRRKINEIAEAYARQAEELRRVRENQEQAEQASNDFYESFKSGMSAAITGAKSLSDALSDILNKLSQMLMNSAFDALFKPTSGGVSGGPFGGLFSAVGGLFGGGVGSSSAQFAASGGLGLFAEGGGVSGPGSGTSDSILARLSNGEFVVNAKAAGQHRALLEAINNGAIPGFKTGGSVGTPSISTPTVSVPVLPSVASAGNGQGGGSTVNAPVSINIDATGADAAGLARVQQELQRLKSEIPSRVVSSLRDANKRGVKF